jgi:hypothetical protein
MVGYIAYDAFRFSSYFWRHRYWFVFGDDVDHQMVKLIMNSGCFPLSGTKHAAVLVILERIYRGFRTSMRFGDKKPSESDTILLVRQNLIREGIRIWGSCFELALFAGPMKDGFFQRRCYLDFKALVHLENTCVSYRMLCIAYRSMSYHFTDLPGTLAEAMISIMHCGT